ncbi:hypothetical protein SDC9_115496 [bioreactor metagenome]|uniref:Uncharacterized protein n=1 Tax=bioreactor metagenome TaxID=1076179 RepID=A0A645BZM8_9ZZZZ
MQIVQLGGNPVEVSPSVAIRVEKALWIDLVDNGVLPPLGHIDSPALLSDPEQGNQNAQADDPEDQVVDADLPAQQVVAEQRE